MVKSESMDQIQVSIIIPTYNRKELLKQTLESLFVQTFQNEKFEIIVCDDGSNDGTGEIIKYLRDFSPCVLKYFRQNNKGPASARNLGISNASGEIIGFTDDDCVVSKKWIENAISHFKMRNTDCVIGATYPIKTYDKKKYQKIRTIQITDDDNSFATCNIFYKKNVLLELGGFDTTFKLARAEDTDLGMRMKMNNYNVCFDKNIVVHHVVEYQSIVKYLKSLNRSESTVLFYKKYPELKEKLLFRFINKKHIYPLFTFFFFINYFIESKYTYVFLLFAILSYCWVYVLIDLKIKHYPLRFFQFIEHFIPDTIRLYYTIRGSIRYRILVI